MTESLHQKLSDSKLGTERLQYQLKLSQETAGQYRECQFKAEQAFKNKIIEIRNQIKAKIQIAVGQTT